MNNNKIERKEFIKKALSAIPVLASVPIIQLLTGCKEDMLSPEVEADVWGVTDTEAIIDVNVKSDFLISAELKMLPFCSVWSDWYLEKRFEFR